MKHFFALPTVLRTAALLASASQHAFSVHDDILAFPQYEVRFQEEWTSQQTAQSRLSRTEKLHSQHTDDDGDSLQKPPPSQLDQYQFQQRLGDDDDGSRKDGEQADYERMVLHGQEWLCRVPKVKKPRDGSMVNETLSKAEEESELARATDRGWELIKGMENNCVFFISGWWSYRFCYNQGVKQFHQLPPTRGVPIYPPMEDPGVPGFMLGTYQKRLDDEDGSKGESWDGEDALDMPAGAKRKHSSNGELVQRGESRYLVQKLGGGTICDLTGKERKIEVQFHCNPSSADRISLIKETSTCHYLMVIQTPRLCNDVAFQPPQKDQPNAVTCSPILADNEIEEYERDLKTLKEEDRNLERFIDELDATATLTGMPKEEPMDLPVGDIYVGEHKLVPKGTKIEKSAIVGGGKETYIDTVASSDGKVLTQEQMEKLGLGDPKAVEKLKKELEKIAKGQNWKLDVIDTPRGREYRGIIGDDEEEAADADGKDDQEKGKKGIEKEVKEKKQTTGQIKTGGKKTTDRGKTKATEERATTTDDDAKATGPDEDDDAKSTDEAEGSQEEYYKEEL